VLAGWAAAVLGSGLLDGALKFAIRRPRPELAANFLSELSWSFPSGHSMASMVTYGMLAYLVVLAGKGRKRIQIAASVCAVLLILSIGFSRLYLGVHYFSDVVGGFTAGALWLSACISGLEVARRLKGRTPVEP
ncbi:MAG TPA: phosphatase PAP2 family protein, partial [Gemmatimonadales bacterium]|nr:phosphatase PAP2 family protein [Gemmatimonadales bacterium]